LNNLKKTKVNARPTTNIVSDTYNRTVNGSPLKPPVNSKKINHFAKQSTVKN